MTADPRRRTRASRVAIAILVGAAVAIVALGVVAVSTLRTSEEGTVVEPDDRPTQRFPSTPVALLAVTNGERLSSLAVMVVDPSGQGGSIVTMPVNLDTSAGIGDERTPFARRAFSTDDPSALSDVLAPMLGIEPSFVEVVDAARLTALLGDTESAAVAMPQDVVDVSSGSAVTVAEFGERRLPVDTLVASLTAISPDDEPSYDTHDIDVATWTGLAKEWSLTTTPLDLVVDESGTPAEPVDLDEVMQRLRAGQVDVRDLAIDQLAAITADNEAGADFVVLNAADRQLVFAAIAPERVLTPNPTLTFSVVAPFDTSQLGAFAEGASTEQVVRELVSQLLFIEANVVFVDVAPVDGGAAAETVIVAESDEALEAASIDDVFGPTTGRIGARDTDGSDVTVVLGTDHLVHRASVLAEREAALADDDGGADFDVSSSGGSDVDSVGEPDDATDDGADTVDADE